MQNEDGMNEGAAKLNEKTKLLCVVGPTASGKTALAVALAKRFDGEVVSCDSMQIYKNMPIATAAPTIDEMDGIPHHLLSFAEPSEVFSVARYCKLAEEIIADIASRGKLPILCGGTGLYYNSLVDSIAFADVPELPELRESLYARAKAEGGEALLRELAEFDAPCAERLSPADTKRIVRAIEVYRATSITMTEHIRRSKLAPPKYELCVIGIDYRERQLLYDRINARVDKMLDAGLIEEARAFYALNAGATAVQAIGYKELKPYLNGECTLSEAIEKLKMETRRYAKRQLSWFRRDDRINWIYADECSGFDELVSSAIDKAKEFIHGRQQ